MTYLEQIQIKRENKIAGLHPAAKMWILISYIICTIVVGTINVTSLNLKLLYIPWFLVVFLLAYVSGEMKKCLKGLKAVGLIVFVIIAVQVLVVPGGQTLWQLGFIKIREVGLQSAFSIGGMVLCVAGIFVWLFQTTSNKEIARALDESGLNPKVAYVFTSSLQMIDVMSGNSKTIMDAQRARGIETEGNVMVRAKAFVPTLIPLILGALLGAEERVLTLEARGFSMTCPKTHLYNLQKSGLEQKTKVVCIVITLLMIAGRVALWLL